MNIEEGCYYITNRGKLTGPATRIDDYRFPWNIPTEFGFYAYTSDGKSCIDVEADDILAKHEGSIEESLVAVIEHLQEKNKNLERKLKEIRDMASVNGD